MRLLALIPANPSNIAFLAPAIAVSVRNVIWYYPPAQAMGSETGDPVAGCIVSDMWGKWWFGNNFDGASALLVQKGAFETKSGAFCAHSKKKEGL